MFQLNKIEKEYTITNFSHLQKLKYSPHLPYAFTEHGVVMAANVLNSSVAVQASIQVVKVFIRMTEVISMREELTIEIKKLEQKFGSKLNRHDKELKLLFEAIHQLMGPPNPPRNKIGYKRYDEAE